MRQARLILLLLSFSAAVVCVTAPAASAANPTIVVTTTGDVVAANDGVLSLREAVTKANQDSGRDVIQLVSSAIYLLNRCAGAEAADAADNVRGDLDMIDGEGLEITGGNTWIQQTCPGERILQSHAPSTADPAALRLGSLRLVGGGAATNGSAVGALGSVWLDHATVMSNSLASVASSDGAAVVAAGNLRVVDSSITDNANVSGLRGLGSVDLIRSTVSRNGGHGLLAGGVWARERVTVELSTISDNVAADTSAPPTAWGMTGGVGSATSISVADSVVSGNVGFHGGIAPTTIGFPPPGVVTVVRSDVVGNRGQSGGGIAGSELTIDESTISDNVAGIGGGAYGAGRISDTTIARNHAKNVGTAIGGPGGGMYASGPLRLERSTVTANRASAGAAFGLTPSPVSFGLTAIDSTVSGNVLDLTDTTVIGGWQSELVNASFTQKDPLISMTRSVIGTPGLVTCVTGGATTHSGGYNFWVDASCAASAPGDRLNGGDPRLSPLDDQGGSTPTRVPLPGSPLRDRVPVDDIGCAGEDQRGVPRPQGFSCDIGAVEAEIVPSGFVGITPVRVLDTRTNFVPNGWTPHRKLAEGATLDLKVAGANGIPDDVTAVLLNITATESSSSFAYVTAWPAGQPVPPTSTLNLQQGANVANSSTIAPGVDGEVSFYTNTGSTHLVIDILGYYSPSSDAGFQAQVYRAADTRDSTRLPSGWTAPRPLQGPETIRVRFPLTEPGSAVVLNITSAGGSSSNTFITAFPAGSPRPETSNVNVQPGFNVPNLTVVKLGVEQAVDIYANTGSTHVVVDHLGYFRDGWGPRFVPINPIRLDDTRSGPPFEQDVFEERDVQAGAIETIPASAQAVTLNVTSTQATSSGGYLIVTPFNNTGWFSNLNYRPGINVANQVLVGLGNDHLITLHHSFGRTHIVTDATGYFTYEGL